MSFHDWLKNFRSALAPGGGPPHHGRRGSLRAASHRLSPRSAGRPLAAFLRRRLNTPSARTLMRWRPVLDQEVAGSNAVSPITINHLMILDLSRRAAGYCRRMVGVSREPPPLPKWLEADPRPWWHQHQRQSAVGVQNRGR